MTTTITLPLKREDFSIEVHDEIKKMETPWKEYNWMGRIIYWVRNSEGIIQRTLVHTGALLVALALMVSIIGVPLLVYASQELIRQQERHQFDKKIEHLKLLVADSNRLEFLSGRLGLFNGAQISLKWGTRRKIIHDLQMLGITDEKSKVPLADLPDHILLQMILCKDKDSLAKYNLKVSG
ncbi:MAG: hypothetical protein JSS30_05965 [Verrucomicrobia bacterium]|nr:hypothetical protein [Verrucomicrobiota bacterium]